MSLLNKDIQSHGVVGESWELSDLPGDCSRCADNSTAEVTFRQLIDRYGVDFGFTPVQCCPPFGLMIKFLDANDILSVQVHPDEHACKKFPHAAPKTECWYVIAAEPDSVIYRGLIPGVSRQQLQQAISDGQVEKLLNRYPAKPDDFHFLPAGTIHALGAGLVIAEIQTPSDTTFRLYDWGRVDQNGRARELHIDQALDSIHYTNNLPCPSGDKHPQAGKLAFFADILGDCTFLANCPYFEVAHLSINYQQAKTAFCPPIPFFMIVLSGSGVIASGDKADIETPYRAGDTILFPAAQKLTFTPSQPTNALLACLGDDRKP